MIFSFFDTKIFGSLMFLKTFGIYRVTGKNKFKLDIYFGAIYTLKYTENSIRIYN